MSKHRELEIFQEAAKRMIYCPQTGIFKWLPRQVDGPRAAQWNKKYAGKEAGSARPGGYRRATITVNGQKTIISLHRLAWFIGTGKCAEGDIDHINQNPGDNRLSNLRDVSECINMRNTKKRRNNTSGIPGVSWHKQTKRWCAQAHINGRHQHIGLFKDKEDAAKASKEFRLANGFTENYVSTQRACGSQDGGQDGR